MRDLRTEEAGMQSRLIKMDKEIANKKQYLEKLNDDFKEREAGLDQLSEPKLFERTSGIYPDLNPEVIR